jgi:hypothetical protein
MTYKPSLSFFGILFNTRIEAEPDNYKIANRYETQISIFKYGFIIEKNDTFISQGELYNPEKDESFIGDVQKSYASIFKIKKGWPFMEKVYTLQKNFPLHKRYD